MPVGRESQLLLTFVGALVACALATPLAATLARRSGVLAEPRPDRWGSRPTPLLGGLAIIFGLLLPVAVIGGSDRALVAIALGTLAAALLGVVDDVRGLRPTSKLVGQVVIASGLALAGVRVEIVEFAPAAYALTVLWVVGMMNAVNLMDNMDGLAAGVTAIAAAVLVAMAPVEPVWIRLLAAAVAGSCVGFLVQNFPPARVYMGDAGSLSLGFVLAAVALLLTNVAASNIGLAVLGPLLALGLPIYDTILVTVARRLEGRPVHQGGRDHTSHRLAALGLSERATVVLLYGVAAGFAALGLFASAIGFAFLPLAALVAIGLVLFGAFLVESGNGARSPRLGGAEQILFGKAHTLARFGGEIALDLVLATTALFSAYLIRFEHLGPENWMHLVVEAAPIVIPLQLGAFVVLGVYRTLWRFLSVPDLVVIARAVFAGTLVSAVVIIGILRLIGHSRAVFIIDAVLLAVLVSASRMFLVWLRHSFALRYRAGDRRVLIVGATEWGEIALRALLRATDASYHPAGFLDDDPGKIRRRVGGVPVLGAVSDLPEIADRVGADLIVLAADGAEREFVRRECARLGLELREFSAAL